MIENSWYDACATADVSERGTIGVVLNSWPIMICKELGEFYAVINRCSHAEFPLVGGRVRRGAIICPVHGATFRLASGDCLATHMHYAPLRTFRTRVEGVRVMVEVPSDPPPAAERPSMI